MNATVTKSGERYVTAFQVQNDFNLHIETSKPTTAQVRMQTSGSIPVKVGEKFNVDFAEERNYKGGIYPTTIFVEIDDVKLPSTPVVIVTEAQ